ncbi:MAG: polysaccharide deacetylase family protein [Pyrinomonadaceae bacterium]|nr:polysaccharide deacetylase family protein [Pyrinomonadaceae bacterium]MCX7638993.1 polysaccharide deacetylase family protein [Pyrinomonadaceae bacterium]MDW8303787.1 polysaccharide deacetylase family protein [Acidobacteriota bacterium]
MKPEVTLSLDLDNKWSYMKIHGDKGWEDFPSYLDRCVPRILEVLRERNWRITFFIVGKDAEISQNHEAIYQIVSAGHEIANHSFNHEPWLHLYSEKELMDEISRAEEAIEKLSGIKPVGFRGPGYSISPSVLKILLQKGYKYDCSTFPTFIGPVVRLFYFLKSSKMPDEEKHKRERLFGVFSDGFQPLKPYFWQLGDRKILEIPVTTFPILKTPIHVSYLLYLAEFSESLAIAYFKSAINLLKKLGIHFSLLLHPLDFLSGEEVHELKFFPAMSMPTAKKLEVLNRIFDLLDNSFTVVNIAAYADKIKTEKLAVRAIDE